MTDSRVIFAFDKASARTRDADGRMRVKNCVLSTAEVNPYRGNEIPGWRDLGLNPNQIYELYRDPEELAKGAPTFSANPIMVKHIPQTADEPRKEYIGGAVDNINFDGKKLRSDLLVWDGTAIDLIESGELADLSCGYRYTPDMTSRDVPGHGRVDGTMRNIQGNHVALVDDGRASGAHVADRAMQAPETLTCGDMAMNNPNPNVPAQPAATDAAGAPPAAAPVVAPAPVAPVAPAGDPAIGDALKHIATILQSLQDSIAKSAPPAGDPPADAPADPKDDNANDADPTDAGNKDDAQSGAEDFALEKAPKEGAFDSDIDEMTNPGPEQIPDQAVQNGADARGESTPLQAMDAASVRKHTTNAVNSAVLAERRRAAGVEEAKRDVRGVLGDVYGMDNAGQIYREALKAQGVDTSTIPKGQAKLAWQTHVAVSARARGARPQSEMAMDSDAIGRTQSSLISKLGNIKNLG